jgi:hypothetical protein
MVQRSTCHIVAEQSQTDTLSRLTAYELSQTTTGCVNCWNWRRGASTTSHRHRTQSTAWLIVLSSASDCTVFWLVEIFATASSNRTPPASLPRHSETPNGIFSLASAGSTWVHRWGPWSCWDGLSTDHRHKCRHSSRLAWRYRRIAVCAVEQPFSWGLEASKEEGWIYVNITEQHPASLSGPQLGCKNINNVSVRIQRLLPTCYLPIWRQVVTICTARFTATNPAVCPHSLCPSLRRFQ